MREILFRGKTPDGRWFYGDHIKDRIETDGKPHEYIMIRFFDIFEGENFEDYEFIIPETLGQYTGLKDKNGKMIFEGDILRSIHYRSQKKNYYIKHICEWSKKYSGWFMRHSEHAGNVEPDYRHGDIQSFVYFNNAKQPEIIGNIYDNTELLK